MKILGTVCIVIVGLFAIFFTIGWLATAPLTKTADAFFDAWNKGQPQHSYGYLAQGFTQTISAEKLHKFMGDHRLNRGVDPSWSHRIMVNNTGTLTGELTRADGSISPITINLVQEQGAWKILGLNLEIQPTQMASNSAYAPTSQYNGGQAWNRSSGGEAAKGPSAATPMTASIGVVTDVADPQ